MTGVQVRRDSLPWSRPLLKPDRHGHSTPLSRPTCAPRATSSRVDSLFESRREVRGGDPPRIPPTARSPPGCSRATLGFDIQLSGVRHPRLVRPDRPSARVTSRSRTRAASACFLSRDTADTRLTDERLLDRRCARADDSGVLRAAPASRRVYPILLEACWARRTPRQRLASSANDSRIAVPITRLFGEEPGA